MPITKLRASANFHLRAVFNSMAQNSKVSARCKSEKRSDARNRSVFGLSDRQYLTKARFLNLGLQTGRPSNIQLGN